MGAPPSSISQKVDSKKKKKKKNKKTEAKHKPAFAILARRPNYFADFYS
jgi:hypothetical protein